MAQIIDRDTFMAFWEDEIATRCNAISHFVEFENSEAMDTFKAVNMPEVAMIMFKPEFRTTDLRSDNVQRRIKFGFFLVKRAANHEDQAEIKQLKNTCIAIVEDIIARLGKLNEESEFFGKYHADATDYDEVEGIFDNHYGCQCFGEIISKTSIKYDATKWTL